MALIDIMTENRYMTDGISMVSVKWKDLTLQIIHRADVYFTARVPIPIKWFAWAGYSWSTSILHAILTHS